MIVGSGPLAPSAEGLGYVKPRPQIDYPNGTVVYLDTNSTSTNPASSTTQVTPSQSATSSPFTQNRQLWDVGPDILTLQQFLNMHGFPLALTGAGSPGSETSIFGTHNYQALIKFQQSKNLPQTGYLGPLTRAALGSSTTQ
jgi:peptidoglycan hydrolase-like protein with peptidoglycan-binding domain